MTNDAIKTLMLVCIWYLIWIGGQNPNVCWSEFWDADPMKHHSECFLQGTLLLFSWDLSYLMTIITQTIVIKDKTVLYLVSGFFCVHMSPLFGTSSMVYHSQEAPHQKPSRQGCNRRNAQPSQLWATWIRFVIYHQLDPLLWH